MEPSTNYRQMVFDTLAHALTRDPNTEVRAKAAESFGKLGETTATPLLLEALTHTDPTVQHNVIQALGQLQDATAVPQLLQTLKNGTADLRQTAATALGHIGSEATIPGLLQALQDEDPAVRGKVAQVLGALNAEAAIPALLNLLTDPEGLGLERRVRPRRGPRHRSHWRDWLTTRHQHADRTGDRSQSTPAPKRRDRP